MNCDEYIDQCLSADADGQLSAAERSLVKRHLRGCHHCRAMLREERALKAAIRRQMGTARVSAGVRLRIQAALGAAAENSPWDEGASARARISRWRAPIQPQVLVGTRSATASRGNFDSAASTRAAATRWWLALQLKRAQYLAPAGFVAIVLIATTVVFRATLRNLSGESVIDFQPAVPTFDFAISRFRQLSEGFAPNVPAEAFTRDNGAYFAWVEESNQLRHVSAELPDISSSYEKMQMPPEFCDFTLAGYELAGGRVDRLPNGEPVTYTLYRGPTHSLLSIGLKQRINVPEGGSWFDTHALYSYRGYSICLTIYPAGHFTSIIIAHTTMVELLRDIATSDVAANYPR